MDIKSVVKDLHNTVLVKCITYNQSQYIEDALNGFSIQRTDFPFVCFVIDDASTDGEQDVIKNWLNRECDMDNAEFVELELANVIIVPHRQNSNCTFAVYLLKRNLWKEPEVKGALYKPWYEMVSYIALCEGDDYWTDPMKLQKQYDALEENPECTICYNRVHAISADNSNDEFMIPRMDCVFKEGKVSFKDLALEELKLDHWCFQTSSFFYRCSIGKEIFDFRKTYLPSFPYGDMPLQMLALSQGEGFFIGETMGCYRFLSGGWNSMMVKNPELNKKMTQKVIEGFNEFDKFTKYRYHKYIKAHNLRKEYNILCDAQSHSLRYLSITVPKFIYNVKSYCLHHFPEVYLFLKRVKAGMMKKNSNEGK